jgi:hypothetical protein
MKSVRKLFKLLCFIFITVFVLGFGGEVFAVDAPNSITISNGVKWYDNKTTKRFNTAKTTTIGGDKYYAFCLDRGKAADFTGTMTKISSGAALNASYPYKTNWKNNVDNILTKVYKLGLNESDPNGKVTFTIIDEDRNLITRTITNADLYGVAQCAIWEATHGTKDGGLNQDYKNWLKKNDGYMDIFSYLSGDYTLPNPSLDITGESELTTQDIGGESYLVSGYYEIKSSSTGTAPTLTASITGTGFEFQVVRNDTVVRDWGSESTTVVNGDKIKVRIAAPSAGVSVSAQLKVESSEFVSEYDTYFYQARELNYQNMSIAIPKTANLSKTINITNTNKYVKFRKLDENGNPLAGVQIQLVRSPHDLANISGFNICAVTDVNGYFTQPCDGTDGFYNADGKYALETGSNEAMYEIKEKFLSGYYNPYFTDNTVDFSISDSKFVVMANNAGYITKEQDPSDSNVIIVNIINDKYLNISKTDTGSGEEIEGAHIIVYKKTVDLMAISDMELDADTELYEIVDEWDSTKVTHTIQGIVPGQTYILSETVAPDGYISLTTDIEFTVDAEGNVDVVDKEQKLVGPKDDTKNWLIVGNDLLSVPKTGISIINLFAIGGLMVFMGYEVIKIYRRRTDI